MAGMSKKKLVLGLVSVVVSASLVAWLLSRLEWGQVKEMVGQAKGGWLALALGVTCLVPLCGVVRWLGVLRAQRITLSFGVALRAVLMANVLNSFLPSKGGDMVKAAYLRQHGGLSQAVGTVLLERLVDLAVLGGIGLAASLRSGVTWGLGVSVCLLVGVAGVIAGAEFLPIDKLPLPGKLKGKLKDFVKVFPAWLRDGRAVIQTLAGSICVWSIAGLTVCCLIAAFGVEVSWGQAYAVFPLCVLAGLVPATVSGIGTRDVAFVQMLTAYGATKTGATLVALGYTVYAYWVLSLISLPAVGWQLAALLNRPEATEPGFEPGLSNPENGSD